MTRYDAVLSPVVRDPPPPLGLLAPTRPFDELSPAMFGYLGYTQLHNIVGAPAISLPLYWTGDGLLAGSRDGSWRQGCARLLRQGPVAGSRIRLSTEIGRAHV